MNSFTLFFLVILLSVFGFYLGRMRSMAVASGKIGKLHSLPNYYGGYVALWCSIPAFAIFSFWMAAESSVVLSLVVADLPKELQALEPDRLGLVINEIKNLASGNVMESMTGHDLTPAVDHYIQLRQTGQYSSYVLVLSICIVGILLGWKKIHPALRARNDVEKVTSILLIFCSTIAIFITIGIVLSVLFEAIRFFQQIPFFDFLFGLEWSPQMAIREDQVGSSGAFGFIPLLAGTMLISFIAMMIAVPIGILAAMYMSEYATRRFRAIVKPMLEILAGIPTVVYGFFAALVVAPLIRDSGTVFGLDVSSESALAAGLVMGIMIIPFVSSLSDDVMNAVPQSMRDGSLGLGATKSETIRLVIFPAALPGIVGGVLLAFSRAIGETMIVVMAAGLTANLTMNPLESVTTVTVQIVTLLVGDQEFDSPKTLAAFALGLMLFIVTLCLNVVALHVVRKYREQYE